MQIPNIHPVFVHFPIGMLTLYGLMEVARFEILKKQPYWFYVKSAFLILGAASAHITVITGLLAEEFMKGNPTLEVHERFALLSTGLFDVLALAYLIAFINRQWPGRVWQQKPFWQKVTKGASIITHTKVGVVLAIVGLVLITITGALGGSMVYGPNNDPMVKFVYKLFVQ